MRTAKFTLCCLGYVLVLVLGVGLGMCVPIKSHAQQILHFNDHVCQQITCANVSVTGVTNCAPPNWCTDITTTGQFWKCMPQPLVECDESAKWCTKQCALGTCSVTGLGCSYTLNNCVP